MILPGQKPAAFLSHAEEELRHLHLSGGGGRELARRRADVLDLVLISLFRQAEHASSATGSYADSGVGVVALGGYGRRELCPYSDVDLMVLYRPRDAERVSELAEQLFYPLWDAGLELGHGARTVKESLTVAIDSLEIETSLLQSRLLVGDQALFAELLDGLRSQILRDGGERFIGRLAEARAQRRHTFGPADALLEPHLKEGRGGLRDLHEVMWLAGALRGASGLEGLVSQGWATPESALDLGIAADRLLRARTSLHYALGRKMDRLYMDYQEDAVGFYRGATGAASAPSSVAVETVMSELWQAAEVVSVSCREIWAVVAPDRVRSAVMATRPENADGRRLSLLRLMREGRQGLARLEWLSYSGLLSAWVSGWESIRHLGQMDSLHMFTVGGHSLRCVVAAVELAEAGDAGDTGVPLPEVSEGGGAREVSSPSPDPLGARLAAGLRRGPHWDVLLLACLLHDVGKGSGAGDHAEAGAAVAARAAGALGLGSHELELLRFLVREHLLLASTAVRRDLDDPALVGRLAQLVGTRERLELLHVLTVADSMSTGAAVWTPWTAALSRDLFFRVLHALEGERDAAEVEDAHGRVPGALSAPRAGQGELPRLSLSVSLGATGGELLLDVRPSGLQGVEELVAQSPVQPGVLSRVAGVLACHGVTILSAQVQPACGGHVTRVFHVADQFEGTVPAERWALIRRDLTWAFLGRLALDSRLADRRARYAASSSGDRQEPARVVLDNSVSEAYTVIEVHAADRIGLLYTLARTFDDLLLEVRVAKVATQKDRVVDVFYVTDSWGSKLTDEDHLGEVARALDFALARGV